MATLETSRSDPRAGRPSALWLLLGPTVWAVHFTILYLAHTLLCAVGGPGTRPTVTTVVTVATVMALAVLTIPLLRTSLRRQTPAASDSPAVGRFLRGATPWLLILSAIAVIWAGATALIVPACGPPP